MVPTTSVTGTQVGVGVTGTEKVWRSFQAIGDIAFAYAYSTVLIEIQACQAVLALFLVYYLVIEYGRRRQVRIEEDPLKLACLS